MDEISIKWKRIYSDDRNLLPKPIWETFPMDEIAGLSRSHAVALFTRSVSVVIKQGDLIISNSMEMRNLYKKKGFKVHDLASIQPDETALSKVGFL